MTARVDVFRIPTRISFGRGVALTLADPLRQVGATKVLLVIVVILVILRLIG